ncbi:MAG: DUF4173 domain-containing protein [Clostridiales bacterium]|nr:DUF4173 domain-containing protein [Clostridiales bacterium]
MNTNAKQAEILKFLCLGLSYAFSYGYISFFLSNASPLAHTIFVTILAVVAVIWLELTMAQIRKLGKSSATRLQMIEVRFWEVILVLLSLNTYFGQLPGLSFFFIHMVVIYMALCGTGHLLCGRSSCLMPLDMVNGMFRIPFSNLGARIISVYESTKDSKKEIIPVGCVPSSDAGMTSSTEKKRTPVWGVIGVLFFILLIFIAALKNLASIDNRFAYTLKWLDHFFDNMSVHEIIFKFVLSIPVGAYLFGLFQGGVRSSTEKEKKYHEKICQVSSKIRFMPDTLFAIVISMFLLVYLVFCLSQAEYMFSAFAGVLPEAFTASEYAVSGFYELINVVLINFVLLSLVRAFGSHENKLLKILNVILMADSMIFATISASKIILYMSRFGYTSSRTLALWGTVVVFAGSLLAIVNLMKKKRTFMPWLLFSASSYVLMNFLCYPFT